MCLSGGKKSTAPGANQVWLLGEGRRWSGVCLEARLLSQNAMAEVKGH
jgi:hypothetical protein